MWLQACRYIDQLSMQAENDIDIGNVFAQRRESTCVYDRETEQDVGAKRALCEHEQAKHCAWQHY